MTFTGTQFGANIKSLGSYLGTLENVTLENFVLHDVQKAINIDLDGQTELRAGQGRRVGAISVRNAVFRNFRGTASIAGTFTCPGGEGGSNPGCSGITLEDVSINGTSSAFSCQGPWPGRLGVFGGVLISQRRQRCGRWNVGGQ